MCLRLKGDRVLVCIFHQREQIFSVVCVYVREFTSVYCPVAPFSLQWNVSFPLPLDPGIIQV